MVQQIKRGRKKSAKSLSKRVVMLLHPIELEQFTKARGKQTPTQFLRSHLALSGLLTLVN